MSAPASPDMLVSLRIDSDPAAIAPVRQAIEQLCANAGFGRADCDEIGLCLNEAIANVIRHAYDGAPDRPIQIDAHVLGGEIQLTIRDWGKGVNPDTLPAKPPDPLKPGGLGLLCLRRMMDQVVFRQQPDGMLLEMKRKKSSEGRG